MCIRDRTIPRKEAGYRPIHDRILDFSEGRYAGCMLDRNGLRPARYTITKNDMMVVAAEVGVMDFDPTEIAEKGRLQDVYKRQERP